MKKNKIDKSFIRKVERKARRHLPQYPFCVGIDKALFNLLKEDFPGERTKLRGALRQIISLHTRKKKYIISITKAHYRNGPGNYKQPIRAEHKTHARNAINKKAIRQP